MTIELTFNRDPSAWQTVADALRDAHQRLADAEWDGQETTAARFTVAALEASTERGETHLVPF